MTDRREFIKAAALATAASYNRILGANDRIRIGGIGTGGRCQYLLSLLNKGGGSQIVAICDVYQPHLQEAREKTAPEAREFTDYPSVGYSVYDVEPATEAGPSTLKATVRQGGGRGGRGGVTDNTPTSIENERYRVTVDNNGDISSIFDKSLDRELLSAPMRLAISNDHPSQYPAWNMDFDQEQAPPRVY